MENSSFKNTNVLHFGDFSDKNHSEEKEICSEKNHGHDEGVLEFFRLIDHENHHLPPS